MYSSRNGRIVVKPELFSEDYVPEIVARDEQAKHLAYCLAPSLRKKKPVHAWLYGLPGSGKTSVVKFVLGRLEVETRTKAAYVNCWENDTLHSVLDRILRDMRVLGAAQSSAAIKLDVFARTVGDEPFVVVVDEIDQPAPRDRDLILYNIATTGKVGLIAISGSRRVLFHLEPRVRSRLNPRLIHFAPYTAEQLIAILGQRAESALAPGSWNAELLKTIADVADGDARVALQTLKQAGYMAEATGKSLIAPEDARAGRNNAKQLKQEYVLDRLTQHHRLLYEIVAGRKEILSTDLWAAYLDTCKNKGMRPIAGRTFFVYVNTLLELRLMKAERADVRGNLRKFQVSELSSLLN